MTTHGFIVGIETYGEASYEVSGPCGNAAKVAQWLLDTGVPGENIHVFFGCKDTFRDVQGLSKAKVDCQRSARRETIDTFWQTRLADGVLPGSRLLFFWSGHGCTGRIGQRLAFYQDYSQKTNDRLFDITYFLERLKTPEFGCFDDQIVLIDACAVYLNEPSFSPPKPKGDAAEPSACDLRCARGRICGR
jgi:hypothetical protein